MENNAFAWTSFYRDFADKLLLYKDRRQEFLSMPEEVYANLNIRYPFTENGELIDDICPFTVIGAFNKGITDENRTAIAEGIGKEIGVNAAVPRGFEGIPVLNNMKVWFFAYKDQRNPDDISNLWNIFKAGIDYADHQSEDLKTEEIA